LSFKAKQKEPYAILKTLFALLIVVLCLIAAKWQFDRGVARSQENSRIEANATKDKESLEAIRNISEAEWQLIEVAGKFDTNHEVLLRNRYNSQGKYGFEYLTLFKTAATKNMDSKTFWVDRGWVQAGDTALTRPKVPSTPEVETVITGRIRLDNSLPKGSFFALPASGNLINSWDLRSKVKTENFYLDLVDGKGVKPENPAELPELSDGPHMAYALQWLFFAGLAIYGRRLIRQR